jgi:hypothetical protein
LSSHPIVPPLKTTVRKACKQVSRMRVVPISFGHLRRIEYPSDCAAVEDDDHERLQKSF